MLSFETQNRLELTSKSLAFISLQVFAEKKVTSHPIDLEVMGSPPMMAEEAHSCIPEE